MTKKPITISWKAWLVIAIVGIFSFALLMVFVVRPPASQFNQEPEPDPYLTRTSKDVNTLINLWAPEFSTNTYIQIDISEQSGTLCKKLTLAESELAAYVGVSSLYTNAGQARIVYALGELSPGKVACSLIFLDTSGAWYACGFANQPDEYLADVLLPALVAKLGYAPITEST